MALHYAEDNLMTDIFGEDVGPPLGVFRATW